MTDVNECRTNDVAYTIEVNARVASIRFSGKRVNILSGATARNVIPIRGNGYYADHSVKKPMRWRKRKPFKIYWIFVTTKDFLITYFVYEKFQIWFIHELYWRIQPAVIGIFENQLVSFSACIFINRKIILAAPEKDM